MKLEGKRTEGAFSNERAGALERKNLILNQKKAMRKSGKTTGRIGEIPRVRVVRGRWGVYQSIGARWLQTLGFAKLWRKSVDLSLLGFRSRSNALKKMI